MHRWLELPRVEESRLYVDLETDISRADKKHYGNYRVFLRKQEQARDLSF
jgi:hypothetical protein